MNINVSKKKSKIREKSIAWYIVKFLGTSKDLGEIIVLSVISIAFMLSIYMFFLIMSTL